MYISKVEESDGREGGCAYYQTKKAHKKGLYLYLLQTIYMKVYQFFFSEKWEQSQTPTGAPGKMMTAAKVYRQRLRCYRSIKETYIFKAKQIKYF